MAKYDFFIAHAGPDDAIAEWLRKRLAPRAKCFLDSQGLRAGADFGKDLREAQRDSRVRVVIVSKNSSGAYLEAEIHEAISLYQARLHKPGEKHDVVPIRVPLDGQMPELPYGLGKFSALDLRPENEDDLEHVATRLLALLPETRGRGTTPKRLVPAFILACDLDEFSLLSTQDQVKAYSLLGESIRTALLKHELSISNDPAGAVIWSPGGDGGTLTLTTGDAQLVLRLARRAFRRTRSSAAQRSAAR